MRSVYNNPPRTTNASQIWCLPGCALDTTANGEPIVPSWCKSWKKIDLIECADDDPCITEKDSRYFKSNRSEFACVRIDLVELQEYKRRSANNDKNWTVFGDGTLTCQPGCLLDQKDFGCFERETEAPTLDWCTQVRDRCNTGQSLGPRPLVSYTLNQPHPTYCTRF